MPRLRESSTTPAPMPRPTIGQRIGAIEVRAISASHVVYAIDPDTLFERLDISTREAFARDYLTP